ncbi:hypothetical protein LB456_13275 [Psychroflexus sp. CAK57W]|uniref:hypothetical protein n=1 Tax=Psychroflexus curvus TaxID=2873595 RepID=UPI001CCE9B08|nr:hypothetical protein [Psychroflexus curvus]MBZ9788432.1 hypothetical protein [Psychroflexus curvus]
MQSNIPNPEGSHSESYRPEEFIEFLQENWIYLAFVLVIIYIVVMYSKILRDRKRNRED